MSNTNTLPSGVAITISSSPSWSRSPTAGAEGTNDAGSQPEGIGIGYSQLVAEPVPANGVHVATTCAPVVSVPHTTNPLMGPRFATAIGAPICIGTAAGQTLGNAGGATTAP